MKRSDAEKLIVDTVEANEYDNKEEWASYILDALLEIGMLPPKTKKMKFWPQYKDAPFAGSVAYYEDVNEWDAEDQKGYPYSGEDGY